MDRAAYRLKFAILRDFGYEEALNNESIDTRSIEEIEAEYMLAIEKMRQQAEERYNEDMLQI